MPAKCAMYGCNNQSDQRDRQVVMSHVSKLSFHACSDSKHYSMWNKLINRCDNHWKGVNKNTRVCSNHFQLGRPLPGSPHPTLYRKGYGSTCNKRKPPKERSAGISKKKRPKKTPSVVVADDIIPHEEDSMDRMDDDQDIAAENEAPLDRHDLDHSYCQSEASSADQVVFTACDACSPPVQQLIETVQLMSREIEMLREKEREKLTSCKLPMDINDIKDNNKLVYLHTGVANYQTFQWLLEEVEPSARNIHYYRGPGSLSSKNYQRQGTRKPGKERSMTKENELLLTLMRIRLDMIEDYLAFLFDISQSTVSQILSTWIPLLSKELEGLIYWPKQEEIREAYPKCFHKFDTVRAIIDCTEVTIQKPSLASANTQIFSSYKNRPTAKFLIACTPAGSISFVSKPAGGNMSDKQITEKSGICKLFSAGDICLADRGFNIQDLLLPYGCKLVMPPFTNKGKQFTIDKAVKTKVVANARIHIERVINRWKDFRILQGVIPLSMADLLGHIGIICGALVNLLPSVIPL